jgi:uncharacterized membrane protein YhdT
MTNTDHLHFHCPSCGVQLTFPEGGTSGKAECPHCYAVISIPEPKSQASSEIVEDSPFDGPRQTGGFLSFVCFLFNVFVPFCCFLGIFMAGIAALFGAYPMLHAIQLLIFMACAGHSVYAGNHLWRMKPRAVHIVRRFLLASVVYGVTELALFIWFLFQTPREGTTPGFIVFCVVFALAWILTPLLLLLLYFHSSRRVRVTFADEFPPERQ